MSENGNISDGGSMSDGDWIDDQLHDAPMPDGLTARLREIGTLSDADINGMLNDLHPSVRLRDQLLSIGSLNDAEIDRELCNVEVSPKFMFECQRVLVADQRLKHKKRSNVMQYALVASILMLIAGGLTYKLVTDNQNQATNPIGAVAVQPKAAPKQPATQVAQKGSPVPKIPVQPVEPQIVIDEPKVAKDSSPVDGSGLDSNLNNQVPRQPVQTIVQDDTPVKQQPNPTNFKDTYAAPLNLDPSLRFRSVSESRVSGLIPPRVREYDLLFQLRHGVHPYVSPTSNRTLATIQLPLTTRSNSFDQCVAALKRQTLPSPQSIRVEEFLASMNYEFADPGDEAIGIRTAAGRSPWNENGLGLLQVGLQAGKVRRTNESPMHLVLAIDGSANQLTDQRWEKVLAGLNQFATELLPQDRVSLFVLSSRTEEILKNGTSKDFQKAIAQLQSRQLAGSVDYQTCLTDLARSVREFSGSNSTSKENDAIVVDSNVAPERVILITSGLVHLGSEKNQQLESEFKSLIASGATLDVFDTRDEEFIDSQLNQIAGWNQHQVAHTPSSREVYMAVREVLCNRSQLVAKDVKFKITFQPKSVVLYRLMGHEASAMDNLIPQVAEFNLRSGETASTLFEIALHPEGPEIIGLIEATWIDSHGKKQSTRQPISRSQFAPSFAEAPWSLQLAAFCAETAEVLRGSYFAPSASHDLGNVSDVAAKLPMRFRTKPDLKRLKQIWEQSAKANGS